MADYPAQFIERMKTQLGEDYARFERTIGGEPWRAIRVNTLKISTEEFKRVSPFALEPVGWEESGFYVTEEKLGKTALYAAGLYYPQEPSAMCAAPLLGDVRGRRVLDLCAAPGGKTTQIAQKMAGEGVLITNEINFSRAKILSQNVERSGVSNCAVTCAPPSKLKEHFTGWFDRILVDAPCSGEGMFRKESAAIENWSVKNVLSCAERQREILDCAAEMLADGGRMVYSTCTFSPEEDEEQIEKFLEDHTEFTLERQIKLYPHEIKGEGHFAAAMVKSGGELRCLPPFKGGREDAQAIKLFRRFEREYLSTKFDNLRVIGDTVYSIPGELPDIPVQCLRAGVRLGTAEGGRFTPDHSLAMYLTAGACQSVKLTEEQALSYLHGNTFDCDKNGWLLAAFKGYPIGWCKASNGTAKNHYPKGLRI